MKSSRICKDGPPRYLPPFNGGTAAPRKAELSARLPQRGIACRRFSCSMPVAQNAGTEGRPAYDSVRIRTGASRTSIAAAIAALLQIATAEAGNTFFVTTTGDPGPDGTTSLRQAIAMANAGDSVQFDAALRGSTITLSGGEIAISKSISVGTTGTGQAVTISGNNSSRIFNANLGDKLAPLYLSGMNLVEGNAAAGCGGAVLVSQAYLVMKETHVSGSSAAVGGGICLTNAGAKIQNSAVFNNTASLYGGGIAFTGLNAFQAQVYATTISANVAGSRGGGIYAVGGSLSNPSFLCGFSTISGNRVLGTGGGGGMFTALFGYGSTFVDSSTISQNYAQAGGGGIVTAYATNGALHVDQSTIASNTTANDADGNGVRVVGPTFLRSSIVANNGSASGLGDLAGTFSANFTLVRAAGTAMITGYDNLFGADPHLGTLANHGGATSTMVPAEGSPVIDKGAASCTAPAYDQRKLPRCIGSPDIGSVERQSVEDIVFRESFDVP